MQIPDAVTIMADPYPRVPGDDVVLDGEDGAPVVVYPGHLVCAEPDHAAGQDDVSPLRHRHVLTGQLTLYSDFTRLTFTPPMKSGPRPGGSTTLP